jgi:hypothetical protein
MNPRMSLVALIMMSLLAGCEPVANVAAAPASTSPGDLAAPLTGAPAPVPSPRITPKPGPPVPDVTDPAAGIFALSVGEEAEVATGTKLRFDRIVSDSRCPAGVQCVWAGEVRIALSLSAPGGSQSVELSEKDNTAKLQSFDIEYLSFDLCPPDKPDGVLGRECARVKVTPSEAG